MADDRVALSRDESVDHVQSVTVGEPFRPKRLDARAERRPRRIAGRRSSTLTKRKNGRYVRAVPFDGHWDFAFDATLRRAAPYQCRRQRNGLALVVERQDWQRKVRSRRAGNVILFVVDASWSMAAANRMEATKGAILSLLVDAYQRRDRVGLVVFQNARGRVLLPPTSSVELAKKVLQTIPVGGKTPLSHGLFLAYQLLTAIRRRDPEIMPFLILLTDGAGNVSMAGLPPQEEALRMADAVAKAHIPAVVVNMEHPEFDRGLARQLAAAMWAPCYVLPTLRLETLLTTVREEIASR